jgi:hypothetical protein
MPLRAIGNEERGDAPMRGASQAVLRIASRSAAAGYFNGE